MGGGGGTGSAAPARVGAGNAKGATGGGAAAGVVTGAKATADKPKRPPTPVETDSNDVKHCPHQRAVGGDEPPHDGQLRTKSYRRECASP
ncbi:MAG: hypothetical protein QOF18_726 [Frankiaceae bacterium]|jgi:hypothetical protein|nr:hypothetical protein [Frankiaceae bacterium]